MVSQSVMCVCPREKNEKWMRVKRGVDEIWLGLVVSSCYCVYFKFIVFLCGFYYFSRFMGLIFWWIRWRKTILNEFLHVYLLRKLNKRKENIDYFNFLGNLHVLSRRTWRTCYFALPKIMKKKKKKKNLITLFNWFMFVVVLFVFVILC